MFVKAYRQNHFWIRCNIWRELWSFVYQMDVMKTLAPAAILLITGLMSFRRNSLSWNCSWTWNKRKWLQAWHNFYLKRAFIYRHLCEKKPRGGGLVSLKTLAQCVMHVPIKTGNKRKWQKVVLSACCFPLTHFNFFLQYAEERDVVMPLNRIATN